MLAQGVVKSLPEIRKRFSSGDPFPHVCVDEFLEPVAAEELLKDFPPFDPERARNEFGEVGPKCVVTDLQSISPSYARLHEYLGSDPFLAAVSEMTGIPDLKFDPLMYGGGTHENVEGAELDPHIDFNYDSRTGYHRRLNLLVYLNKEWSEDWGGAIELHSNPLGWYDGTNSIRTFNCLFNRCVIFETSERSWHGFRRIRLPADKAEISRKLISVYLYTTDRPAEEIAPAHGTFYVPYPPPDTLKPEQPITRAEYDEIRRLTHKRDALLSLSFQKEKQLSAERRDLAARVRSLEDAVSPVVMGYGKVSTGSTKGYFSDRWAATYFEALIEAVRPVTSATLHGWLPEGSVCELEFSAAGASASKRLRGNKFEIRVELAKPLSGVLPVMVKASPLAQKDSRDSRDLAFVMDSIVLHH